MEQRPGTKSAAIEAKFPSYPITSKKKKLNRAVLATGFSFRTVELNCNEKKINHTYTSREYKGKSVEIAIFGTKIGRRVLFTWNQEICPWTFTTISIYQAILVIFAVHFVFVLCKELEIYCTEDQLNSQRRQGFTILLLLVVLREDNKEVSRHFFTIFFDHAQLCLSTCR